VHVRAYEMHVATSTAFERVKERFSGLAEVSLRQPSEPHGEND
jgi:hypothetical protein